MKTHIILLLTALLPAPTAWSQNTAMDPLCSSRLSIVLTGTVNGRPGATEKEQLIDDLLAEDAFVEHFSRFINASFNDQPGETPEADAPYYLSSHVLKNDLPWNQIFSGPFIVARDGDTTVVRDDPEGLGYFRSPAWRERYAGNEGQGILLSMAYRMLQNVLGLVTKAADVPAEVDASDKGREAAGCRSCHFDSWFSLDRTASVLGTVRDGRNDRKVFDPPSGDVQKVLGAFEAKDDRDLVRIMLESEHYRFNTCSLIFRFLYGRDVVGREGPVFDQCMAEFKASGKIRPAIKTMVSDPSYCG